MSDLMRVALAGDCTPVRTCTAANMCAEQAGEGGKILSAEVDALFAAARCCYWCGKSLGRKETATLDHLRPLSMRGPNSVQNLRVACATCFLSRRRLRLGEPLRFSAYLNLKWSRMRQIRREVLLIAESTELRSNRIPLIHYRRATSEGPWMFLAGSKTDYEDSLQHFKLTAAAGRVRFVRPDEASPFRGLLTSDESQAKRMVDELGASCRLVTWAPP